MASHSLAVDRRLPSRRERDGDASRARYFGYLEKLNDSPHRTAGLSRVCPQRDSRAR
jgi:hypothetical protein